MADPRPRLVFLMGPTAAGKTDLAVDLVERLQCAIVSVDSALVYRQMDIGTAKPSMEVQARAPHRLIDIRDPVEPYNAAAFRADARRAVEEILGQGRVPLLVGGTGLYFRAFERGLAALPPADPVLRERLTAVAASAGWPALHRRLAALDPVCAARIQANDAQRIQRALEVYELTGMPLSRFHQRPAHEPFPYRVVKVIVEPTDRSDLYRRIGLRFNGMLSAGLVDEVQALRRRGDLDPGLPSMRAVGYRQVWEYLDGELRYESMVEQAITATRHLAKRQMTWFRSEHEAVRVDSGGPDAAARVRHSIAAALEQQ